MELISYADIAGDDAAHALATSGQARFIYLTATGGAARFGDASVAAGQGVELPKDVQVTIRCNEDDVTDFVQLAQAHAYVPTGTTLTYSTGQ